MKLIEAMKRVKMNKEKVADLQRKIAKHCANLEHETLEYGTPEDTRNKITEWLQACTDLSQENVRLLLAIQRTNLATPVTIELSGQPVTKPIAAWVWRRREYAQLDLATWLQLTDRGLKEGDMKTLAGDTYKLKLVRHFDAERRDDRQAMYRQEPHEIDAALEIVNATTDLLEGA